MRSDDGSSNHVHNRHSRTCPSRKKVFKTSTNGRASHVRWRTSKNRVNWRLVSAHACLLQNSFLPPCQAQLRPLKPSNLRAISILILRSSTVFTCLGMVAIVSSNLRPCFTGIPKRIFLLFLELNRLRLKLLHNRVIDREPLLAVSSILKDSQA